MQPLLDQGQQWRVVWLASAQDAEVSIASRAIALIELRLRRDFEGRLMLAGEWLKLAERSGESAHFNRAIQLYQDALDEDPDNVTGLNNLAYLLLRYVGDCQEAMTLSARAARLAPRNADVLDTHAQALVCLNRLEEAEAVSRSAVAQRETDPGLLLTLARVLLAQDRFGEGVLELDRARNLINADPRPNVSLSQEIEALWRKLQQRAEPSLRP